MGFNPEDKVSYKELSPSLQELIDSKAKASDFQAHIDNWNVHVTDADRERLKILEDIDNQLKNHKHTTENVPLWEHYHKFDDLSFYERFNTVQTGSNSNIIDKNTFMVWGDPDKYNVLGGVTEDARHPLWVKHQQVYTTSDGVRRLFLGCASPNGSTIYMSDEKGLNFQMVNINTARIGVWDLAVFNGYLYALHWTSGSNAIVRTKDGIVWETVISGIGFSYAKTLCVFNGVLYHIGNGSTLKTTDGVNWVSVSNNITFGSQVYSRGVSDNYMYVGICGGDNGTIWLLRSTDGANWTSVWGEGGHSYLRWLTPWKPKNSNVEYVVFGTGGTGNETGTACLMCYDPTDGTVKKLFDFRTGNGSINDGHAPIEPRNSAKAPIGFRERQIRYIQVFDNDYTGENFLLIGCSDNHLYAELSGSDVYYKNGDLWTADDKKAWQGDHVLTQDGAATSYSGNVYAVGPRSNTSDFKIDDLIVSLIKHTEDTRVYSMNVYYDTAGKKWLYVGTGGANYNGKGLLYRFGYGEMLDIIQGTKLGAILPPKWQLDGQVNKRLTQTANSFFMKTIAGASARNAYIEGKYSFIYGTVLPSDPAIPPYYSIVFCYKDSGNYYELQHRPSVNKVVVVEVTNNVSVERASYDVPAFAVYTTTEENEAIYAPKMGPIYMLCAVVQDDLLNVYFKKTISRQDKAEVVDYLGSVNIGANRKIGRYGVSIFDIKGVSLISMKQQSLLAYADEFTDGVIKFGV